jgi:hypothetical protein
MFDWESSTKFEGSFIGHTFIARLASDPNIVVDSYTVETTKIIDCPNMKQSVATGSQEAAQAIVDAEGIILPLGDQSVGDLSRMALGDVVSAAGASIS